MQYKTLVSVETLAKYLDNPNWAIFDCRFYLDDTNLGRQNYLAGHIPGAQYVDLENDLSSPIIPGKTSRHPLPDSESFAKTISNFGISDETQVVVYDDRGGGIAARLWWMLRWMGHESVAVLDGGIQEWQIQGHPLKMGEEKRVPAKFVPHPRNELMITVEDIMTMRNDPANKVVDSRAEERYRGQNETLDPIAGHIPGAINAYYGDNFLEANGRFKDKDQLKSRFKEILGDTPANRTAFYCGSGVTANVNILAVLHAGLGDALLYPGSWSEWITDPNRPVTTDPK